MAGLTVCAVRLAPSKTGAGAALQAGSHMHSSWFNIAHCRESKASLHAVHVYMSRQAAYVVGASHPPKDGSRGMQTLVG